MKKRIVVIGTVVALLVAGMVSNGFCWGSAVHAYIGSEVGAKAGIKK